MEKCIFCKIIQGEIPAKIIGEDNDITVFLDLKNHPLIVTKKHIENIYSLESELGNKVMAWTIKVAKAVKKGLNTDGVNIVQNNEAAAGQEVMHFHLHVKPRYTTDSVELHLGPIEEDEVKRQTTLEKIKQALE